MTNQELIDSGKVLPVMEMFYSLQGEGYHTGKPAFFIRIGGCDVGCFWCDVKESWKASLHPLLSIEEIVKQVKMTSADAVVITGGEPFLYNLNLLTKALKKNKYTIFIETSGTAEITGIIDWICLSPKKNHQPLPYFFEKANELKVIIHDKSDFEWAEQNALKVNGKCKLYLQPEWSVAKKMTPLIIDYIKKNTKWTISLQTHKFLNIP